MPAENALDHADLIEKMRPRIIDTYQGALAEAAGDAAVFLLDVRDPDARSIAERADGPAEVAAYLRRAAEAGAEPIATWGVPRSLMLDLFEPGSMSALSLSVPLGEGHFWLAVLAGGTVSIAAVPVAAPPADAGPRHTVVIRHR